MTTKPRRRAAKATAPHSVFDDHLQREADRQRVSVSNVLAAAERLVREIDDSASGRTITVPGYAMSGRPAAPQSAQPVSLSEVEREMQDLQRAILTCSDTVAALTTRLSSVLVEVPASPAPEDSTACQTPVGRQLAEATAAVRTSNVRLEHLMGRLGI